MTLGRRAFLVITALWPLGCRRAVFSVDEFVALSTRLTGFGGLDREAATTLLNGFLAAPGGVARLRRPDLALERDILTAWYTGVQQVNGEARLVTHLGALQWRAIGVRPTGTCAGAFGAWSSAPPPA
jgi:hypothetical protein